MWIFFFDFWYKKKYIKRCFVCFGFGDMVVCVLCDGGLLCLVMDWEDYVL